MIEANIRVKPHMENEYRGGEWDMNGLSEVKKIIPVDAAFRLAKKGETVLLSPCCASFDLFNSYEDRGDQFKEYVRAL